MSRSLAIELPAALEPGSAAAPSRPPSRRFQSVAVWTLMGLMGLVYIAAMFMGLEAQSGYQGNSYLALHPESFPNDRYMHGLRPTQLSLFYVLARLIGDSWLDDRVTFLVAWAIALVSLVALDRTVRLLGATRISERVALWSLMLLEHRVLMNHARLIDTADFNPTMLAGPAALWLLYQSLAGGPAWVQAVLMGLLASVSLKVAAMPILIACVLLWRERLTPGGRLLAAAGAVIVVGVGWWYYAMVRPADGGDAELFRWIVRIDGAESHPFLNSLLSNAVFIGLCLGVFGLRGLPPLLLGRVRAIAALGLLVWLGGGLYLSFAPEPLQVPHLALFGVVRSLWWVQYVVYVAYGVWLLKRIQEAQTWKMLAAAWALLAALTLLHVDFRGKMAAVIIGVTVGALARSRRSGGLRPEAVWRLQHLPADARARVVAVSLCLGTLSLYEVGTVHHRWHDLAYLLRHGVMGDNPGAKWVEVSEYFRTQTPASASVLALSMQDHRWSPEGLRCDGWLRSRSGRTMPVGPKYNFVLDQAGMRWHQGRVREAKRLVERWKQQDATGVLAALARLDSPDYLVVPRAEAAWVSRVPTWPYGTVAVIHDFTIMRRTEPARAPGGGA